MADAPRPVDRPSAFARFTHWLFHGLSDPVPDINDKIKAALSSDIDRDWWPPNNTTSAEDWDRFWRKQIEYKVVGFTDMFVADGALIDAMRANGLRSVLCVGAGLSMEPHALAVAGFDVAVLDLSPLVILAMAKTRPPAEHLTRFLEGREPRAGGSLAAVAGDLRDLALCPGPFDVIIERKTLQLFHEDRDGAMAAVIQRLAPNGLLFSHAHNGAWRPSEPRTHPLEAWFDERRWPRWRRGPIEGQVVEFLLTTG